ncbi:aldolase [Hysterangium stoloniferum]|nr:aldolase [Hysterangium stoloniferum]
MLVSLAARLVRHQLPSAVATYAKVASQPNFVRIVEVGPRDGLQNEKSVVSNETKIELIERLQQAGLGIIESGSFVSPKWVPQQMAGTAEVLAGVKQLPDVRYPVLVPNARGLDNLLELLRSQSPGSRSPPLTNEIAIFTAASESFSKANTNKSVAESLDTLAKVTERALSAGLLVRGYISTVDTCPFEGRIDPVRVKDISLKLKEMGCYEISLGDTVGTAVPATVTALIDEVTKQVDIAQLAVIRRQYHDTFGMGTANVIAAVNATVGSISSYHLLTVAGLGGCPYSPGATGNVATEARIGFVTGVDTKCLVETGEWISKKIGRQNESRAGRAWMAKRERERRRAQETAN